MKKTLFLTLVILIFGCRFENKEKKIHQDNKELIEIYNNDQSDRSGAINWRYVRLNDSLRRVRVDQLLDSHKIITANDYKHAAMVFQHGNDSLDYGKVLQLMKKAISLDSTMNKWLLAATIDRYLLIKGDPQIYGTQYHRNKGEPWRLAKIDTTKISDTQRIEYGVRTLAEQRQRVKEMNGKSD
jgi:hypothetical protein